MTKVICAVGGALSLLFASILTATPALAASVTASCANTSGSISALVGETITIGAPGGTCSLDDTSGAGVVESQALGVFIARSAGTTTIAAYTSNGIGTFTNTWAVTVSAPAPSPTPTPTPTLSPRPSPTSTATATPTATVTPPIPSSTPTTAVPTATPYAVPANEPMKSQKLRRSNVTITTGNGSGQLAFFGPNGQPLQLLSIAGASNAVTIVDAGINYSSQPSNWQRLNYGDTCWSYTGYTDTQGFVLPIATPPFSALPANWLLTAAIVGTPTGNVTFLNPQPGQIVDAGGRDTTGLTLCAKGYANAFQSASSETRVKDVRPTGRTSAQMAWVPGCSNGQATGNKHCQGSAEPMYPGTLTGGGTTSTSSTPWAGLTPATSRTDERVIDYCQATTNRDAPYTLVRNSLVRNLPAPPADAPVFSDGTAPWGSIVPAVNASDGWPAYAGQNWTDSGRAILSMDCAVPLPSPTANATPTPSAIASAGSAKPITPDADVPALVCKATGDSTNPYRTVTVPVSDIASRATSSIAYPTIGWTDILPPAPGLPLGQNWPVGKALLDAGCTLTVVQPEPQKIVTGTSPGVTTAPGASFTGSSFVGYAPVITVTPLPQPTFTAYSPPVTVPALPQTTFSGFSPWPPVTPVPLYSSFTGFSGYSPTYLVPYPVPQATPSPTATPTLMPTATPTPIPLATPASAQEICQAGPCLLPPTTPPGKPYTALIALAPPSTGPTPSTPSRPETATDTVSFVLTNGPSTVTYTTTVAALTRLATPNQVESPGKDGPTELANTGEVPAWPIAGGLLLVSVALLLVPVARGRRLRLAAIGVLTVVGLVTSTSTAWSVASAERAFGIAQSQAATSWGGPGDAIGRLAFVRPGEGPLTNLDPVYVFSGIDEDGLKRGPGWYPSTAGLGERGNTAIAGHRTGYGSPFAALDELRKGDTIVMQTPAGDRRTYRVDEVRLVATDDVWVLGPNPLGTGTSTLTLTTCDPPGVNTRRLVVLASLVSGSSPI